MVDKFGRFDCQAALTSTLMLHPQPRRARNKIGRAKRGRASPNGGRIVPKKSPGGGATLSASRVSSSALSGSRLWSPLMRETSAQNEHVPGIHVHATSESKNIFLPRTRPPNYVQKNKLCYLLIYPQLSGCEELVTKSYFEARRRCPRGPCRPAPWRSASCAQPP